MAWISEVDYVDRQTLNLLIENGWRTVRGIGQVVNVSPSPVPRRREWLAHRGVIAGYTEVIAIYTVAGDPDAIVHFSAGSLQRLHGLIDRIRLDGNVIGTNTLMVIASRRRGERKTDSVGSAQVD